MSFDLSIIIPIYNEEENIDLLLNEIVEAMKQSPLHYEILVIDDGSTDQSIAKVSAFKHSLLKPEALHCIALPHWGKSYALSTGFKMAKGNIIITLDGDLQDDPQEILHFIQEINKGYDMVSGWKLNRQDPQNKKTASLFFNKVTSFLIGKTLHDFGSGFKAYRRCAVEGIVLFKGAHRFMPALVSINGFTITEIQYKHRPRRYGHSKYGILRIFEGLAGLVRIEWLILTKKLSQKT